MSVKSFLKNRVFFVQLAIAFCIVLVSSYLVVFSLKVYTDHGESLVVPDLNGMTVEQSAEIILANQLRYRIIDSLFVKNVDPGTIVGQMPTPGARVKKNRIIFITTCTMAAEQVSMPKLTDIAYRQALNVIESSGLEVGAVSYKPSEYVNLVLEQHVGGGSASVGMLVQKGTPVDLVVGQNFSGDQIEVPDLIGESYLSVKETLEQSLLNFGAVVFDDSFITAEDSINAIVWKQRPKASDDQKLYQGQSMDVWLTIDEEKVPKAIQK